MEKEKVSVLEVVTVTAAVMGVAMVTAAVMGAAMVTAAVMGAAAVMAVGINNFDHKTYINQYKFT
jgi:drug/metabolite transporter (DMT)-like permease